MDQEEARRELLLKEVAITEGQPGECQDPLPEIDGTAHPKVRINVDGSKFDFNADEEPELCAGTAVLIHAHPGKQFWHSPPLAIHRERTAEARRVVKGRSCAAYTSAFAPAVTSPTSTYNPTASMR